MNAIAYGRVSTDEQEKSSKTSLDDQIKECHRYATRNNLIIVAEITDDFSGGTIERPGFLKLRALLTDGFASAVICTERTRLSRDAADYMYLRKQWGRAGIEIHFCDSGKIQYDYAGVILDSTLAGASEGERIIIRKRTMQGRIRKAKELTKPVMSGQPPIGYDKVGHKEDAILVINEHQKRIVMDIFEWYVRGDGINDPLSLNAIAEKMDNLEPPPSYKNRKSVSWHPSYIRRILQNEVYIGRMYYQKTITEWGKRTKQPKEKWIRIDVPELAFIDQSIFNAAQVRAKKNKERAKRNRKHQYLLTGHIRCGSCGYAAIGLRCTSTKNGTNPYYRCGTYTKKHVHCDCSNRNIATQKIDDAVWDWIVWLLSDDDNLRLGIKELIEKRKRELKPKSEKLVSIREMITDANQMIKRLTSELSKNDDEIILATIREQLESLGDNLRSLEQERLNLEGELSQLATTENMENQIIGLAEQVRKKLPASTYKEKRTILDLLDVRVTMFLENREDVHIEVSCEIPPPADRFFDGNSIDVNIVTRTS